MVGGRSRHRGGEVWGGGCAPSPEKNEFLPETGGFWCILRLAAAPRPLNLLTVIIIPVQHHSCKFMIILLMLETQKEYQDSVITTNNTVSSSTDIPNQILLKRPL